MIFLLHTWQEPQTGKSFHFLFFIVCFVSFRLVRFGLVFQTELYKYMLSTVPSKPLLNDRENLHAS